MNTNFLDSVPVDEKNTQIALSLNVLLYIILKIKLKFQCSNIAGKLQIPYYIFSLKDQK